MGDEIAVGILGTAVEFLAPALCFAGNYISITFGAFGQRDGFGVPAFRKTRTGKEKTKAAQLFNKVLTAFFTLVIGNFVQRSLECRNTKSIPLAKCPKCSGYIVSRKTKGRGKEFYGCTNFPDCDFISHFKPVDKDCPQCGQFLVEKYDKKKGNHLACIKTGCNYIHEDEKEEALEK